MTVENKRKFLIDIAFVVLLAAVFYFVLKFCTIYLLPFIIGLFLAFIVQKPAVLISKRTKINKGLLSVVFVVILYLLSITVLSLLGILIYDIINSILKILNSYFPSISAAFANLTTEFEGIFDKLPVEIANAMKTLPDTLMKKGADLAGGFVTSFATTIAKSLPGLLITVIVTIVASCYIAKDYDYVVGFVNNHTSEKASRLIGSIKEIVYNSIFKLGKSYLLLMMITFAELCVGLWVIGINNPITVAALVAVVDIMPVLGTGTVVIPWAVISMLLGSFWQGVALLLLYLIITVVRNFLEPKIIGDQVGIHPLLTLFAIFLGLKLFGVIGVIVCPITLIVIVGLEKRGEIKLFSYKN